MRDRTAPQLSAYLEAENAYTRLMMQDTETLQTLLYEEMLDRLEETELSVPYRIGDFYYYSRTEAGKNYSIFCRKQGSMEAPEEVLIDGNELAKGHTYFRFGVCEVSQNHQTLAYSIDTQGAERYTLFFLDLNTFELHPEKIPDVFSFAWSNDNKTCFYTKLDGSNRSSKIFRHSLGRNIKEDVLLHYELDEAYNIFVYKTRSMSYILMYVGSLITSETYYLDANQPTGDFQLIHYREHGIRYEVEHHSNSFYILTNDEAINYKLMKTPVVSPSKENWQTIIPAQAGVTLEHISAFADHLVLNERVDGLPKVRIIQLGTGEEHYIDFPEPVYQIEADKNPEFSTSIWRFYYKSLVTPDSIFDYNMVSREFTLKKQTVVRGGYDKTEYVSERIWANATDGKQIPISLVYKQGMEKTGQNPLLLIGYGAYGVCEYISFSSNRLSLIERGVIIAIVHVRGGGEMGYHWYQDGKLLQKKNTFTDFIACAEHLISNHWTSSDRLAIFGESAGGMLIGAALNMRPDLFKIAVAKTPFVDVLTSILDTSLPLSVLDWDEWGNPNDITYYEYIKSYSPYDNVKSQNYPHLLITAGFNDSSVPYWEPVKWTAKLRALKNDDNILLLKINMGAGHRGTSGRYDGLRDLAFEYAFLLGKWGLNLRD
ncbi:MAG: oligopeptidase B [Oscillatoriaceae cyanobacterium]